MPTLEELNAMLADPGFQERHKEFERQMYERLEPLGNAIQKMMKPTPPSRQDPDLMTEEELSAAFEAMPLPARQEAMKRALDEEMGPVAVMSPTSGVTSIPLGAPWPPLSREQVVKLHEALVAMSEKLTEQPEGMKAKLFHGTFVSNAQDLCSLLTHLNITNDPKLEMARRELERAIANVDITDIREDPGVRIDLKAQVDAVLGKYDW